MARQALYHARQDELSHKLRELEAEEAAAVKAYSRQKEATATQRLTIIRQIDLLHPAASARVPSLEHITGPVVHASLPPHLQISATLSPLVTFPTSNFIAGTAAPGFATPTNAAPPSGTASSGRGQPRVIMQERLLDPPPVAISPLACPIYAATYIRK